MSPGWRGIRAGRRWPRWPGKGAGTSGGPAALVGLALAAALVVTGTGTRYIPLSVAPGVRDPDSAGSETVERLRRDHAKLEAILARRAPKEPYVVIDRINNRIALRGPEGVLVLEAPCSTGSNKVLVDRERGRQWHFATPVGMFRVISKSRDPVWRKPDWVFIEEGQPIPEDASRRFEYGALGEYGLYFGDGYLIHGTLYERLLGRSVSHGCVRVGAEPLRTLYEACPVGTPIFVH